MNLFLVPASEKNIKKSITGSVASRLLEEYLTSTQIAEIKEAYGDHQPVHCWAMTEGNRKNFSTMRPGDIVLFTMKGTGKFNYIGVTAYKMECPKEFGNALWPYIPNDPWTLVYFLNDVAPVDIDKVRLVTDLGYKSNFVVQGLTRVGPERLNKLTGSYGSFSEAIAAIQSGEPSSDHEPQTTPSEAAESFIRPPNLVVLIQHIELLRHDASHKERAHEALVEDFYIHLGYNRFSDIKYRPGSMDISMDISVEAEGRTLIVNEVKRSWGLSRSDQKTIDQGYRYANRVGARFVVITNGDYYAFFDRTHGGLSISENFIGELTLTRLRENDLKLIDQFKKTAPAQ